MMDRAQNVTTGIEHQFDGTLTALYNTSRQRARLDRQGHLVVL